MKPYYEDGRVTLYNGRAEDIIPRIGSVDLVVTSPPYNMGPQSGAYANMRNGYKTHADNMPDEEYVAWQQQIVGMLWDATAPRGAIFYNHKPLIRDGVGQLPTRYLPDDVMLRQVIIWNRRGGMNWSASHFCPQHEWVMLLAHRDFRLLSRGHSAPGDVWDLGIDSRVDGHPCAFPESLPTTAIAATDAKVILDPFAGSGTTLRAANDLGRRAIGIELDESYCELIARRMDQMCLDFGDTA